MKPQRLTPILWTDKMEETIDFYTQVLGFTCDGKNDDWGWATMYNGSIRIMLGKPNEHEPFEKPIFTGSFYFYVEDVDGLWNELKDKVKIAYPIENFEWEMREFAIYDNNGYMLQFGEEIK